MIIPATSSSYTKKSSPLELQSFASTISSSLIKMSLYLQHPFWKQSEETYKAIFTKLDIKDATQSSFTALELAKRTCYVGLLALSPLSITSYLVGTVLKNSVIA